MKRHFLGSLLFFIIITTTGLTAAIYRKTNFAESKFNPKISCCNTDLQAKQALINLKNDRFVFDIRTPRTDENLVLSFYEKTANGTDLIAVEKATVNGAHEPLKTTSFYKDINWASRVKPKSNIYLVVEREKDFNAAARDLNAGCAISVLVVQNIGEDFKY